MRNEGSLMRNERSTQHPVFLKIEWIFAAVSGFFRCAETYVFFNPEDRQIPDPFPADNPGLFHFGNPVCNRSPR